MRTRTPWMLGCLAAMAGLSCTKLDGPSTTPLITHLVIVQGDSQTAKVSTTLPIAIAVLAYDDSNRAATGAVVCFQVANANSGSIVGQVNGTFCPQVDNQGHAAAAWTIGPNPGGNIALVSGGTSPGVSFYATGTP